MEERSEILIIRKGTNANTIKVCFITNDYSGNPYGYNGIDIGTYPNPIDNIAKSGSSNGFWLSADGGYLVVDVGKNCKGFRGCSVIGNNIPLSFNALWQPIYCFPNIVAATSVWKLRFDFIQNNNGVPDLTLLESNHELDVLCHYVTED